MKRKHVVIIGGGFGGLMTAKSFKDADVDITIVDRTNHHVFQPLLYQVATAALSPGDIAVPIRAIFTNQKNVTVIMDEAIAIEKEKKIVQLKTGNLKFDILVVAPGSKHSYFGKDEWQKFAPGLKTLDDALKIREKIIHSLEIAERINDLNASKKYLTFVIVGGGPTGVELAGAIAEIAKQTMIKDFRNISARDTKVYLVEALPRVLTSFTEDLSRQAKEDLEALGVEVLLNTRVSSIDNDGVLLGERKIGTANVIWAAGNVVSPLIKSLGVETDKSGRALVNDDLSIDGYPDIFVIGDAAAVKDKNGEYLPAIAPVAMQQGAFVGKLINNHQYDSKRPAFKYFDKGTMATIGKAKAVAMIRGLKLSGVFAWLMWGIIHIFYLIGFRNRFRVMAEWIWYYFTRRQGIRLIVGKEN